MTFVVLPPFPLVSLGNSFQPPAKMVLQLPRHRSAKSTSTKEIGHG